MRAQFNSLAPNRAESLPRPNGFDPAIAPFSDPRTRVETNDQTP